MCRIYAGADPADYEPQTRSMRIHGVVTSVRLEARFWALLEEMAVAKQTSLPRFVATLHDEAFELHCSVRNFASLLRVACVTYLQRPGSPRPGLTERSAVVRA